MVRMHAPLFWLRTTRNLTAMMLGLNVLGLPVFLFGYGGFTQIGSVLVGEDPFATQRGPQGLNPHTVTFSVDGLHHPGLRDQFLYLMSHNLAMTLATIPMLFLAYRLVDAAIRNDPFTSLMARRIRRLGLVVLIGGASAEVVEYACGRILIEIYVPQNLIGAVETDTSVTLWWAILGPTLLAISEVVRRGVSMRDELDGVI